MYFVPFTFRWFFFSLLFHPHSFHIIITRRINFFAHPHCDCHVRTFISLLFTRGRVPQSLPVPNICILAILRIHTHKQSPSNTHFNSFCLYQFFCCLWLAIFSLLVTWWHSTFANNLHLKVQCNVNKHINTHINVAIAIPSEQSIQNGKTKGENVNRQLLAKKWTSANIWTN